MAVPLGATATRSVVVTRDLTVAHFHAGMPEAYGTPMMVYLMSSPQPRRFSRIRPREP
jgi:hypothetical protein